MGYTITSRRRKTVIMGLRTSPDLKSKLDEAARQNGRSLTQEIESRLERDLVIEELDGGPEAVAILECVRKAITEAEGRSGKSWLSDTKTWSVAFDLSQKSLEELVAVDDDQPAKRIPRRAKPKSDELVPVTIRCSFDLKARLDRAIETWGGSLN